MTATSPATNCNLTLPHHSDMALVQIYGKEDFSMSNWSKDKVNTSKTPQNKGENRVAKRKLYSPGGAISEDEDKKVTPKRRKSLLAIEESSASTPTSSLGGAGVGGSSGGSRPSSTGPSPAVSSATAGSGKSASSTSIGSKSATGGSGGLLGTPRLHTPLSERQQMALLMHMAADEHQTGNDSHHSPYSYGHQGSGSYRHGQTVSGGHGPISPHSVGRRTPSGTNSGGNSVDRKLHKRNERGETPLHVAAIKGDVKQTKKLIKDGADVNVADYAGWTPLHEACNQGYPDVARQLIKAGADVNVRGLDNDTPLHDAAVNGHVEIVQLLMDNGANPQQTNAKGKTPLDVCSSNEIVQILRRRLEGNGTSAAGSAAAAGGNHRLLPPPPNSRNTDSDDGTTSPPLSTSPNSVGSGSPMTSVDSSSKKCGSLSLPAGTGITSSLSTTTTSCRPTNGTGRKSNSTSSSAGCATTPPSASSSSAGVLKNVQVSHTMRGSQLMVKFHHVKRHENGSNSSERSMPGSNVGVVDGLSSSHLGMSSGIATDASAIAKQQQQSSHSHLAVNNVSPNHASVSRKSPLLCNGAPNSQHKLLNNNHSGDGHEANSDPTPNHIQWSNNHGQSSPISSGASAAADSTNRSTARAEFEQQQQHQHQQQQQPTSFSSQFEDISDAEDEPPRPASGNRIIAVDDVAPVNIYPLSSLPITAPLPTNYPPVPVAEHCHVGPYYPTPPPAVAAVGGTYPSISLRPWNELIGRLSPQSPSVIGGAQTISTPPQSLTTIIPHGGSGGGGGGGRNVGPYFGSSPQLRVIAAVDPSASLPVDVVVDPYAQQVVVGQTTSYNSATNPTPSSYEHLINSSPPAKLPLDIRYNVAPPQILKCDQTTHNKVIDRDFMQDSKVAVADCSVKSEVVVKVECTSAVENHSSQENDHKMDVDDDYRSPKHETAVPVLTLPKSEPSSEFDKDKSSCTSMRTVDANLVCDWLKTESGTSDNSKCKSPAPQLSPKLSVDAGGNSSRPSTPVASVLKVPPLRIIIPPKSTGNATDSASNSSVITSKAGNAQPLPYIVGGSAPQEIATNTNSHSDDSDQVSDSGSTVGQLVATSDSISMSTKDEISAAASQYDSIVTRRRKTKQATSCKKEEDKSGHQSDTPSTGSTTSNDSKQRASFSACSSSCVELDETNSARTEDLDSSRLSTTATTGSERRVTRASARSQQQKGGSAKERVNKTASTTAAESGHSSSRCEPDKDSAAVVSTDGVGTSSSSGPCRSGTPPEDDSGLGSNSTIPRSKHKKLHRTAVAAPPDPPTSDSSLVIVPVHPFRKPTNPYVVYASIKSKVAERKNRLCCIVPKPPAHFSEYSLVKRRYVLHDGLASGLCTSIPSLTPAPASLTGPLRDLFIEQEQIRHQLRLQHIKERERIILLYEQETLRVNCHAARASVDSSHSGVLSACSLLNIDEGLYGGGTTSLHGQLGGVGGGTGTGTGCGSAAATAAASSAVAVAGSSSTSSSSSSCSTTSSDAGSGHEDREQRARFGTRHFVTWMQDVQTKFGKLKEDMAVRHQHEADVLCAVQRLDWEWKVREIGGISSLSVDSATSLQTTSSSNGSQSDDVTNTNLPSATSTLEIHVPLVPVDEDFNFPQL